MNKPPSTRISTYLLLLVFALSIPLFMAVGYSIYQDIQQSVEHSKTSVKAMLGMLASNTSSTLNKARYTLEQLAVRPLVKNIDSSKCDPILENIKSTSEKYANAAYSNLDGTVVCSAVEQPDGKPVNIGKTQGFQKLLKAKQFTVGEPFLGPITGKWVSLLSVPIWNERHEMIGGVHLPLDLMASVFDIPDQYLPEQTRYGLINQDGILVWHSVTPEKLIGTRPIAATVQLMSALRSGELEGVLSDGVTRYFASAPIPGTAWIAFAVVPDASIYAEPKRRAVTALIVTLFVIGLLMTLAIFIARRINRPISELGRVAVDIHNGNLDIRVNEEGPTEIAMLACEFNSMVTTLQQQNAQLSAFLENSAVIAWLKDESGRHVFCSNNFLKRFALTRDAAYGKTNHELFPADVADVMSRNDQQLLTRGGQLETIEVATNPDGSQSWWLTNKFIFSDSSGKRLVGGLAVDVTQRELSERAIKASEQRFRDLVNATDGIVWEADATTFQFTFISDKAERLLGFPLVDWLQPGFWASNLHPDDKSWAPGYCASCTGRLEPHNFEYRFIARDGRTVWLQDIVTVVAEDGRPRWLRGIMVDITVHKQAAEEMRTLAFYDTLTALPNRRLMRDRLEEAIASSAHDKQRGALMLIDLDNFKKLNDSLGHDMGDQLLIEVARRLLRCVREGDTAARLGGDEFVVILKNLGTTDLAAIQAEHVAENIRCELGHPYALQVTSSQDENNASLFLDKPNTHDYHATASIGIAVFLGNAASTAELMKRADTAMYQAKNAGRNACCFFDPINQAKVKAQAELEDDLRSAVARSQFLLHYQAQIGASGDVVGAEVLVRWQHPTRGLVSPAEFIPLAEESGLILPIGYWVLETACKQLAIWAARPETAHLTLAVNVSARQFSLPTFVEEVVALLEYTGATPDKIKLELTESMLLENTENIIAKMTLLKARGIGFSLDDFGTGYSSLSYLKSLPLDQLKIDQSFVRDVLIDASDDAIARTIISLGKSLGLSVIAEGVETAAQRDFLEQAGCHAYQGYFFSKPLPLESFETYLRLKPNLPI